MLHSEKPLPDAITHGDEIARLILVELRGLRDDMAAKAGRTWTADDAQQLGGLMVDNLKRAGLTELREPAPPAERPLDALAGPKRPKKAT